MGLFDKLFGKKPEPIKVEEPKKERKVRKPKEKKAEPVLSEKEKATQAGEPYVSILKVEVDPTNINNGAFELDWNDIFVARLIKAGYQGKVDADIVDQWFQNVCRHVVMETWEQEQAIKNSGIWVQSKDIGNGRSEVS